MVLVFNSLNALISINVFIILKVFNDLKGPKDHQVFIGLKVYISL